MVSAVYLLLISAV